DVEAGAGGGGGGKTGKLSSGAWCVCRWLISCMKKDEPAVGATTFQNTTPSTPPTGPRHHLLLPKAPTDKKKCVVIDLDETL
ncbi:hypothetical protein GBAR_LOCUS23524, partial [Geodia barretti]